MSKQVSRPAFGKNLMALREARRYSIGQACSILNVMGRYWHGWENGSGFPGPATLIRICKLFQYYDIYRMMTEEIRFKDIACQAEPVTENVQS